MVRHRLLKRRPRLAALLIRLQRRLSGYDVGMAERAQHRCHQQIPRCEPVLEIVAAAEPSPARRGASALFPPPSAVAPPPMPAGMEEVEPARFWIGGSTEFNAANAHAGVPRRPASDGISASAMAMCSAMAPIRTLSSPVSMAGTWPNVAARDSRRSPVLWSDQLLLIGHACFLERPAHAMSRTRPCASGGTQRNALSLIIVVFPFLFVRTSRRHGRGTTARIADTARSLREAFAVAAPAGRVRPSSS